MALLPVLFLVGIRYLSNAVDDWKVFLQMWIFFSVVLLMASLSHPHMTKNREVQFQPASIGFVLISLSVGILYWFSPGTFLAWLLLGCVYSLLLGWITIFGLGISWGNRILLEGAFTIVSGLLPASLNQIETHFSTEEFFVALEVAGLMTLWLVLRGTYALWTHTKPNKSSPAKLQMKSNRLLFGLGLLIVIGIFFIGLEYQRSFYPPEAPQFPEISSESPFICGEVLPAEEVYQSTEVFEGLLKAVEANPNKKSPEFAFLALGTQDQGWASKFRDSILAEARAGLFTDPTGSVKYGQYLASQRAYFYPLVRDAFPGLFTSSQEQTIQHWFAAVNQRTFTVEWVDWMYALAFRYWPQGPYENQENGAGLISILESNQLADPELGEQNQKYLAENLRGWERNFRVTDDAAVYQSEWMQNAWFQSIYKQATNLENQKQSFEWLKLLALPDGSPLRYNHLGFVDYANIANWGANLMGDESLLWLAGRAIEYQEEKSNQIGGQPGAEITSAVTGNSPTTGSCLLYGDSGLPTQSGPLAPDKIVFRSGWESDDFYLLLNLRFTGWHRYKATNALMQVYKKKPLLIEDTSGESFDWLPTGRSIFRDKRIPRENLNGLQIKKSGLAEVLFQLTGIGGPWAQDPPYYAEVARFETMPDYDLSSTIIDDWHGWRHQRTIYFYHDGVIVILDEAQGPKTQSAALTWNLVSEASYPEGNRIPLGSVKELESTAEVVLLPITSNQPEIQTASFSEVLPGFQVKYTTSTGGSLQTVTSFLFNEWRGAEVQIENSTIIIRQGAQQIEIPLNEFYD